MLRCLRTPANPYAPEAQAVDDRSGFVVYHSDLRFQYEWRGNALTNLHILVTDQNYDIPNEQFRPRILPPDPVAIRDPRPPFWAQQEAGQAAPPPDSVASLLVPDGFD